MGAESNDNGTVMAFASWGTEFHDWPEVMVFNRSVDLIGQIDFPGLAFGVDVSTDGQYVVGSSKHVHANQFGGGGRIELIQLQPQPTPTPSPSPIPLLQLRLHLRRRPHPQLHRHQHQRLRQDLLHCPGLGRHRRRGRRHALKELVTRFRGAQAAILLSLAPCRRLPTPYKNHTQRTFNELFGRLPKRQAGSLCSPENSFRASLVLVRRCTTSIKFACLLQMFFSQSSHAKIL